VFKKIKMIVTRCAPSPTGHLHAGHAYAARFAYHMSHQQGHMCLRIDDLDQTRSHDHFVRSILDDLDWLQIHWKNPLMYQSKCSELYQDAIKQLQRQHLLYPCFCTRKQIKQDPLYQQFQSAPHNTTNIAAELFSFYPGTCKKMTNHQRRQKLDQTPEFALRLDLEKATETAGDLYFYELGKGPQKVNLKNASDPILARKNIGTAYHLSVVIDDYLQNVNHVTRAEDLAPYTHLHRLLQHLLKIPDPLWCHHRIICDHDGKRLSKRDNAFNLSEWRKQHKTPDALWQFLQIESF
ncbi:MAG: tRNA glutamyl-Q(34) synthetase GluQRS, partial [Pseudomonadota bacterium]